VLERFVEEVRAEIRRQVEVGGKDTDAIESELHVLRGEQRNLARAIAGGGEGIPELISEMRQRTERIRKLEADLEASARTPVMAKALIEKVEALAYAKYVIFANR
jgi:hypothetical protein